MKLYEIVRDYPLLDFAGDAACEIRALHYDSRRVLEGGLFFCYVGRNADGHDFVTEALQRKAAAIVLGAGSPPELWEKLSADNTLSAVLKVHDTREAAAYFSRNIYPIDVGSLKLHLVVSAQDSGAISQALADPRVSGENSAVLDGMRISNAGEKRFIGRNHPEAPELSAILSDLTHEVDAPKQFFLPLRYQDLALQRARFLYADCIQLLDADADAIRVAAPQLRESRAVLVNADGMSRECLHQVQNLNRNCISYGMAEGSDVLCRELRIRSQAARIGSEFICDFPDGRSMSFFVGLPGLEQVRRALGILARSFMAGGDLEAIREFLAAPDIPDYSEQVLPERAPRNVHSTAAVEKTEQTLQAQEQYPEQAEAGEAGGSKLPFTVLLETAWEQETLAALLKGLRPYCRRRLLLCLGISGDRDTHERTALAACGQELSDEIFLTCSQPRSEGAERVLTALRENLGDRAAHYCDDRAEAIRHAVEACQEADLLLIAGRPRDNYIFEARGARSFSDYETAYNACVRHFSPAAGTAGQSPDAGSDMAPEGGDL